MFIQDKIMNINERLKVLKGASNIIIWGAGVHTCKLFERTELLSYNIKGIVDIDKTKQEGIYFGFIIKAPEKILWSDIDAVVISVPNREKQITETLTGKFKFFDKIIVLYEENEITPFYLLYDKNVSQVRYLGDYDSWNAAYEECKGYEDENIINTVIDSVNKVLKGDAVWERDGFLFYETKYAYQICAAILRCALQNNNKGVRVLDIGGSLGSTYFQNRKYLEDINNLEYVVAEQEHFADYGQKNLQNGQLSFMKSTDIMEGIFDIVLMSASLQYISEYENIVSEIVRLMPRYIILDRLLISDKMRICRETVPEEIYKSSYPLTIFTEKQIRNYFEPDYKLVEKDISSVPEYAYFIDGKAVSEYFVFQKVNN